jgi:TatD DNase family protein
MATSVASQALYDAHNHLQDQRLASFGDSIVAEAGAANVRRMVVNGSCEEDWPAVLALARRWPQVIPSFGYHPWYVKERTPDWKRTLVRFLEQVPSGVGEIGLDRWLRDCDPVQQEEAFVWQLQLAAERNLPVSIHCLQAWGKLLDLLKAGPVPRSGFLLHSFGGPREMIEPLARLGAYFSLPGYFAHERKERQRETFLHVPPERLLIETDAPDQLLPPERVQHPLTDAARGKPLNHPANLAAVYQFAAELLGESLETLANRVEENFLRLFGPICAQRPGPAT